MVQQQLRRSSLQETKTDEINNPTTNSMKIVTTTFFLTLFIVSKSLLHAETDCESHDDHPTLIVSEVPT